MKRAHWMIPLSVGLLLAAGAAPGCNCASSSGVVGDGGNRDAGRGDGSPLGGDGGFNACGDWEPSCTVVSVGPTAMPPTPFPLPSDQPPPSNVSADGVNREPGTGYLILDQTHAAFDFLWIADDYNYNVGLVSKLSTKRRQSPYPNGQYYGEVARYATVTCQSAVRDSTGAVQTNATASKENVVLGATGVTTPAALCQDGHTGCCSWDQIPTGAVHQAVNVYQNRPSRTAVDFNGDVWVANRAHEPQHRQSSVTKIANSLPDCIERNGLPGIQTSSDLNGDGIITTDCDGNNLPDDAATVCTGGRAHEFFGLDDECILFTVNTGPIGAYGRPLALGPGSLGPDLSSGSSDAWAGTFYAGGATGGGVFYRVSGSTGKILTTAPMATQAGVVPHPYGAAIDSFGILWAPNAGTNSLFYFDTNAPNPADPMSQGMVTDPLGGGGTYGIAIDGYKDSTGKLIQQVWLGEVSLSGVYRYRPPRTGTALAGAAAGTWARVDFTGPGTVTQGRGIGVDNRSPNSYAWVALDGGAIGRVPTSVADGMQTLPATGNVFPTMQNGTLGAGVSIDGDIWGINQLSSSATHFSVNAQGTVLNPTTPDTITLDDNPTNSNIVKPLPYTYSDFTGFGLRNFTNPHGTYDFTQVGCGPMHTRFLQVLWDADTPTGTSVTMRARAADDLVNLPSANFTGEYLTSPADLKAMPGPVLPSPAGFLDVEFILRTTDKSVTPKLKSFQIIYECVSGIG